MWNKRLSVLPPSVENPTARSSSATVLQCSRDLVYLLAELSLIRCLLKHSAQPTQREAPTEDTGAQMGQKRKQGNPEARRDKPRSEVLAQQVGHKEDDLGHAETEALSDFPHPLMTIVTKPWSILDVYMRARAMGLAPIGRDP